MRKLGGGRSIPNQTKHSENGFVFTYLCGNDRPGYVELDDEYSHNSISEGWVVTGVPNVTDVHVPTKLTYGGQEFPVLGVQSLCKDAAGGDISAVRHLFVERGIYYMSEYNSNAYNEWLDKLSSYKVPWSACYIHVPDNKLNDAAICWGGENGNGYGLPVFSDKRNYIPGEGLAYQLRFGEKTAYDVDGDGHIDMAINYYPNSSKSIIFLSPTAHKSFPSGCNGNESSPRIEQIAAGNLILMGGSNGFTNLCTGIPYTTKYTHSKQHSIYTALTADFDGDGKKEIISDICFEDSYIGENYIKVLKLQADGSLMEERMSVTSDTSRIAQRAISDIKASTGGGWNSATNGGSNGNVTSLGQGMFVKSRKPDFELVKSGNAKPQSFTPEQNNEMYVADFNGDGQMDFYFKKSIYYNLGGGEFFKSAHDGRIYSADFNGDGLADFLDFTKDKVNLYITQTNGSLSAPKTIFSNGKLQNVFFGDFDKDGDVDVLLFVPDGSANATYFVFLRNDGKGNFKKKESYIEGIYEVRQSCADYDGDGLYELYATKSANERTNVLIHIAANLSLSTTILPEHYTLFLADFNHDGITEMVHPKKIYSKSESYIGEEVTCDPLEGASVNTRPDKMNRPQLIYQPNSNQLKITWQRGHDAQTSACDLTYELRIGSTPGGNDIMCANALPDGTRRNLLEGEMGRNLQFFLNTNNLAEGTYYVSVQAIDAGRLGSEWSDEAVYVHKVSAPVIAPIGEGYATSDTLSLRVLNPQADATYEWILPNAQITATHAGGREINAFFTKAGEHPIKVIMHKANGQDMESNATSSFILPFRGSAKDKSILTVMVDMDQDGAAEIMTETNLEISPFLKRNPKGEYEKLRLSFNSDFENADAETYLPLDYNRDGFPDFYIDNVNKGNLYINMAEGDGDYEYEKKADYEGYIMKYVVDLNNDGYFDILDDRNIPLVNQGDNLHFSNKNYWDSYLYGAKIVDFYDVNRDGVPDLIWLDGMGKTKVSFKTPQADITYSKPDIFSGKELAGVADFNSDGLVDGYYFDSKAKQFVIVKGRPQSEWICDQEVRINVKNDRLRCIVDLDNNGFPDIVLSEQVVMMYEGFNYKVIDISYFENLDEYHWQPLANGEFPNGLETKITNQAPLAPAAVVARQTEQGLFINWADAYDAETPAKQMRYNVSVKRQGQTGDDAFLISPMNGLSDKATIGSGIYYRRSTQMLIPASVLTEGETYEVQVQAIDLMGEHSPMTTPTAVTINGKNFIEVEQATSDLDIPTTVKYVGPKASSFSLEATHSKSVEDLGNGKYKINWAEAGAQTVTLKADGNTYTTQVYVNPSVDMTIHLGDGIYMEAPFKVKVPEAVRRLQAANLYFGNRSDYSVQYTEGDSIATFYFHTDGFVEVVYDAIVNGERRVYTAEAYVYRNTLPQPAIKFVSANGTNYMLFVNAPMDGTVKAIEVSRQNALTKQYEVIGTANNGTGKIRFIDTTCDNTHQAYSYRVRYVADNGVQTSESSTTHTPLHLSLNQCAKGINLLWNAYEGLDVDEYIILRGTTPKNCQEIARVDGNMQNYIDATASTADEYYYAVAFAPSTADDIIRQSWSNVVAASDAIATQTFANSLKLTTLESNSQLSDGQRSLHLLAVVLPTFTDISKISWHIKNGADVAKLLPTGELLFTNALGGQGSIVVEAHTLDGSNLTAQLAIPYNLSPDVTGINNNVIKETSDKNGPIRYYDLTGRQVKHLVKGHIYITSQGEKIIGK